MLVFRKLYPGLYARVSKIVPMYVCLCVENCTQECMHVFRKLYPRKYARASKIVPMYICTYVCTYVFRKLSYLSRYVHCKRRCKFSVIPHLKQGCKMVYFHTKTPNLGMVWKVLEWKMFVYFMTIWNNTYTVMWYIL
jgi:hypothetical protein